MQIQTEQKSLFILLWLIVEMSWLTLGSEKFRQAVWFTELIQGRNTKRKKRGNKGELGNRGREQDLLCLTGRVVWQLNLFESGFTRKDFMSSNGSLSLKVGRSYYFLQPQTHDPFLVPNLVFNSLCAHTIQLFKWMENGLDTGKWINSFLWAR